MSKGLRGQNLESKRVRGWFFCWCLLFAGAACTSSGGTILGRSEGCAQGQMSQRGCGKLPRIVSQVEIGDVPSVPAFSLIDGGAYNLRIMNWPIVGGYAKNVWAVAGPLVGVLIGAYISNRNQRKQWIADHKRVEYQTLLSAMTDAFGELLHLQNKGILTMDDSNRIHMKVHNAISNCIFISDAIILNHDVFKQWTTAAGKLQRETKI